MKRITMRKTMAALLLTLLMASTASAAPWKFGVMADTQWISQTSGVVTDDTRAPNSVPVDIIRALNQQFINNGVKFVVQVGDLCDSGSIAGEDGRALFAQDLYNAGIGFFPFRGNHDSSVADANEFLRIYPQTVGGNMNASPSNIFSSAITGPNQTMPSVVGSSFPIGINFSSPNTSNSTLAASDLTGLSYSFDFNNNGAGNTVRLLLLDGQAAAGTDNVTPGIDPQQPWISSQLQNRPAGSHAFVMSHKGLITDNHVDVLFGSYPYSDPAGQNAFFSSLYNNGVRYYLNGHDHIHDRSRIYSPDGTSYVNQLLCASDSSKFYTPGYPLAQNNDILYDTSAHPGISGPRQTIIAQELYHIGYYIFTVDGPRVTVDYYSAPTANVPNACSGSKCEHLITTTNPASFNPQFVKAETFGYSLNGKEFLVAQGTPYTTVTDSYAGTTANILSGTNGSTLQDYSTRPLNKAVDTGWTDKSGSAVSNILTLWGMNDLYQANTDTYTLSMNYDPTSVTAAQLQSGLFGLATRDANGNLVNALNGNNGGTLKFVQGPWNASYGLGTYGVDTATSTAWAVINHASDFAVAPFNTTDISAQISAKTGNLVYSRATRLYSGNLTITNNGGAITAPVAVALNSLTAGVTLANAVGSYNSAPYTTVSASGLAAGASITVPVSFSNPANAAINFTPVTFQE
jgi:Calcineurin-like phosphoesterase